MYTYVLLTLGIICEHCNIFNLSSGYNFLIISSGHINYRIKFCTAINPSQCSELIDIKHGDLLPPEGLCKSHNNLAGLIGALGNLVILNKGF